MPIQRKALIKWTLIVLFCGAHSFFWGVMTKANYAGMAIGLVTIIMAFAFIESHPRYQRRRAVAPRLARALDYGVKIRLWFALFVFLSLASTSVFSAAYVPSKYYVILMWPYIGEALIGLAAVSVTQLLMGGHSAAITNEETLKTFFGSCLTTLTTGLLHTIILALICLLAYGVIRLRNKPTDISEQTRV